MTNKDKTVTYLKMLSAWANNVARIVEDGTINLMKDEFKHDATAHANKLKQMVKDLDIRLCASCEAPIKGKGIYCETCIALINQE